MKTIREIADEIGVSKQAVFKKIKREPLLSGEAGADQQHQEPEPGQRRSWFSRFFGN